jgi:AcrR family transcriptional regulator
MTPAGHRVLAAASDLFYRRGITAVGVATIAATAGVTKKTLYDCFGSKDALIVAYLSERHATWWAYLEERLAAAESPRVLAVYEAYLTHPALDHDRGCAFLNGAAELPRDHPGFEVIRAHKRAVRDKLAELVRVDHPDLPDQPAVAEHLFLLLEGAVAQAGIDGTTKSLRRAEAVARTLLSPQPLEEVSSSSSASVGHASTARRASPSRSGGTSDSSRIG